jgi:hypothetical protein
MRFGTWNVRNLDSPIFLVPLSKELSKYELDLLGVQEIIWESDDTEPAGEYILKL